MNKRKNFDEAIKMADQSLDLLGRIDRMDDKEKLIAKVNFNKCSALFDKILILADKKSDNLEMINKEFEKAKELYEHLIKDVHVDPKGLASLAQKFDIINQLLGQPEKVKQPPRSYP